MKSCWTTNLAGGPPNEIPLNIGPSLGMRFDTYILDKVDYGLFLKKIFLATNDIFYLLFK